jgi:predicted CXXCH cytochrome family protein
MASPLFPRWTNTVSKVMAGLALLVPALAIGGIWYTARTPFQTGERVDIDQPVQFDHRHHNWEQGIDCRYCHTAVESSANAGIPSTTVCIGCHGQVWNRSPRLEPVRKAFFEEKPIEWAKVHDLPEFVYFNHSIHVNKGVGCAQCHGRVDQMPTVHQYASLTMSWCLECHRNPGPNLRPLEEVTSMTWQPPAGEAERTKLAQDLVEKLNVHPRQACDTCHR